MLRWRVAWYGSAVRQTRTAVQYQVDMRFDVSPFVPARFKLPLTLPDSPPSPGGK